MKFLLDTCTLLWLSLNSKKLTRRVRDICSDDDTVLILSTVSCWEIVHKIQAGKLKLSNSGRDFLREAVDRLNLDLLPLDFESTIRLSYLPVLHRDPFDRMLASAAIENELPMLTPDLKIAQYGVKTVWD